VIEYGKTNLNQESAMSDEITPELFEHLVELAALDLDPEEASYLRAELNNQLASIHIMDRIPLEDSVQPASHGVPYTAATSAPLRKDEHIPCQDVEAILDQAPQTEDGYIIVPEIPHEELD
jgi:aspartyl/glutamyl-tRNA(Asn/Gln) amidotransferase C subunit